MSYVLDPGFPRGHVLGALWSHPTEKTDPTVTGASQVNTKKSFTDVHAKTGAVLSNEIVTCVAIRNGGATNALPGTEITVNGYKGVVDEYLPAVGVKPGEVFWLVIDGPTQKPLNTRVTYLVAGTSAPRLVTLKDGTEVPEDAENVPSVRTEVE
jgi:hypothetical protein